MSYRPYFIEVSGSIIAKEGKNYTQNWVASSCHDDQAQYLSGEYNENQHAIRGDLILDKKTRAVPYATYYAKGSVGIAEDAFPGTDLAFSSGFYPAFAYFKEYIAEIRTALEIHVHDEARILYYNGLYLSAFSVLELFLCDFLLCGVFFKEEYYEKALVELNVKANADQYTIEKKIKDVIFHKVFHRFDDIKKIYNSIFGFGFPDFKNLNEKIHKRHNIVHRFALSNLDRMTVCNASYDDVESLIMTIVRFVEDMTDECGLSLEEREIILERKAEV